MSKRKAPSDNVNSDITDMLIELANYEKNVARNGHKSNVYRKAAAAIAARKSRIANGEEAKKIPGVGEKIAKKIDELLSTGSLEKLNKIRADHTNATINSLTRVMGIGPAAAHKFVNEDKISSINDLHKIKDKLNKQQKLGLKYFQEFEQRIPRNEVDLINELVQKSVKCLDEKYRAKICGSYRRGMPSSGDVDFLITHSNFATRDPKSTYLKDVVDKLCACSFITDVISQGSFKFMGVCQLPKQTKADEPYLHRRIDFLLVPIEEYFCAILHFTGSDLFNKRMRAHASEKEFILNESTLRPIGSTGVPGKPVKIDSERDIFDYIDFPYCDPVDRKS